MTPGWLGAPMGAHCSRLLTSMAAQAQTVISSLPPPSVSHSKPNFGPVLSTQGPHKSHAHSHLLLTEQPFIKQVLYLHFHLFLHDNFTIKTAQITQIKSRKHHFDVMI